MTTFNSTSLVDALNKTIDVYVDQFIQEIMTSSTSWKTKDDLKKIWNEIMNSPQTVTIPMGQMKTKMKKNETTPKKSVSSYVNFCNKFRNSLKEKNPSMTFGDISKQLGKMWSELDTKEQQKYRIIETEHSTTDNSHNNYNEETLTKYTLNQLKQICEQLNIKKTGNKKQLIDRILETCSNNNKKPEITTTNTTLTIEKVKPLILYDKNDEDHDASSSQTSTSFLLDEENDDFDLDLIDDHDS
jgi:hypothetical protein